MHMFDGGCTDVMVYLDMTKGTMSFNNKLKALLI